MSGPELKAIKTAATDLKETAGIYLRNPDYVATAGAEQKAPSSGKANKLARRSGNQLNHPNCSCLTHRARNEGGRQLRLAGAGPGYVHAGPPRGGKNQVLPVPTQPPEEAGTGLQPGATTDADRRGFGTGLGEERPEWFIVPEIMMVVCKSKKAVFHSSPASGSTRWAYQDTESSRGAD